MPNTNFSFSSDWFIQNLGTIWLFFLFFISNSPYMEPTKKSAYIWMTNHYFYFYCYRLQYYTFYCEFVFHSQTLLMLSSILFFFQRIIFWTVFEHYSEQNCSPWHSPKLSVNLPRPDQGHYIWPSHSQLGLFLLYNQ